VDDAPVADDNTEEVPQKPKTVRERRDRQLEQIQNGKATVGDFITPETLKTLAGVADHYKKLPSSLFSAIEALQRTPPLVIPPTTASAISALSRVEPLAVVRNPLVEGMADLIEISHNQHEAAVALVQAQAEASETERRHFRATMVVIVLTAVIALAAAVAAWIAVVK
jgi:hypothetical protein